MELQQRHIGNVVVLDIGGQLTLADGSVRLSAGSRRRRIRTSDTPKSGAIGRSGHCQTPRRHRRPSPPLSTNYG